jgi:hypothetical protein
MGKITELPMKILLIADQNTSKPIPEIMGEHPDIELIITLGDLYQFDIQALADIVHIPKIGVYGNHCDGRYMEPLGIKNLHLATFGYRGLTFMGYEGCVRYKPFGDLQSTQEECAMRMKCAPKVDVFISHCPPRGINDNTDSVHFGFDALREYVDTNSPRFFFHGHTYEDGRFVERYKDTRMVYVTREKIMEI